MMRLARVMGLAECGVIALSFGAMEQDNPVGTSNGIYQAPKPPAKMINPPPMTSPRSSRHRSPTMQRTCSRTTPKATSGAANNPPSAPAFVQ